MRLRRKHNLEQRIEACNKYALIRQDEKFFALPEKEKIQIVNLEKQFQNSHAVHLEIGCGKGGFVCQMAKKFPDINFVAVEKLSNVIVDAYELIEKESITNVRFLNCNADSLLYFLPHNSIETIYLNFSCPFPKKTYANRRLTATKFLKIYDKLMTDNGQIVQKTDNRDFFLYSVEQMKDFGFVLSNLTHDLHHSEFLDGNVMTEYEAKFSSQGHPIYSVKATKPS